jgi:hypothetical protein
MAVIRCIGTELHWAIGYGLLAGYFLFILIYCLVPIIRRYEAFGGLSALSRATRIGFAIALSMKMGGDIALNVIGHVAWPSARDRGLIYGLFLAEFPCYLSMSCYSLVLIFWLSACTRILPTVYVKPFQRMKRVLIGFNILAYLLFVGLVIITLDVITPFETHTNLFGGAVAIGRDFLLAVIFVVFLITFRLGITDDASVGDSVNEQKMFGFTVMLSIVLDIRGALTLAQGLIFSESDQCNPVFFALVMVNEIVCEGIPFVLLIKSNNEFLERVQTDIRSPLGERLAVTDVLGDRDL